MEYSGNKLKQPVALKSGEILAPYLPAAQLVEAVAYARALRRPLLLKGEPGCGKTLLAKAVAYEWHGENYRDCYFEWPVKSSSKAADGLYAFDHIARLRDAQLQRNAAPTDAPALPEEERNKKYRKIGPLGAAFEASGRGAATPVLLIDEIDKADIDFPNDLLLELDQMRFFIPETQEEVRANPDNRPFIVITSNDEKELPVAFLRRCIFHYIDFPDQQLLTQIVQANFARKDGKPALGAQLIEKAVARFQSVRARMENEGISDKKVSTSELKDWVAIIESHFVNGLVSEKDLLEALDEKNPLPFYQVLLKTLNDQKMFVSSAKSL